MTLTRLLITIILLFFNDTIFLPEQIFGIRITWYIKCICKNINNTGKQLSWNSPIDVYLFVI